MLIPGFCSLLAISTITMIQVTSHTCGRACLLPSTSGSGFTHQYTSHKSQWPKQFRGLYLGTGKGRRVPGRGGQTARWFSDAWADRVCLIQETSITQESSGESYVIQTVIILAESSNKDTNK